MNGICSLDINGIYNYKIGVLSVQASNYGHQIIRSMIVHVDDVDDEDDEDDEDEDKDDEWDYCRGSYILSKCSHKPM